MVLSLLRNTTSIRIAALAAALVAGSSAAALAQSAPFAGLAGSWSGTGSISLADGSKERLRCKASYQVTAGEARLQQSLRCASDSYRFDLNSNVVSQQGTITGTWSEASHGISGGLAGRERSGAITAVVDAPGFTANCPSPRTATSSRLRFLRAATSGMSRSA